MVIGDWLTAVGSRRNQAPLALPNSYWPGHDPGMSAAAVPEVGTVREVPVFVGLVVLTFFASYLFPGASLLVPLLARRLFVRLSRRYNITLWVIAVTWTALTVLPFVMMALGLTTTTVTLGPVTTVP